MAVPQALLLQHKILWTLEARAIKARLKVPIFGVRGIEVLVPHPDTLHDVAQQNKDGPPVVAVWKDAGDHHRVQ